MQGVRSTLAPFVFLHQFEREEVLASPRIRTPLQERAGGGLQLVDKQAVNSAVCSPAAWNRPVAEPLQMGSMLLDIAILTATAVALPSMFTARLLPVLLLGWGVLIVMVGQRDGLYRVRSLAPWWRDVLSLGRAAAIAAVIMAAVQYAAAVPLPHTEVLLAGLWSFAVLLSLRFWHRYLIQQRRKCGQDMRRVLIIGTSPAARQFNRYLRDHRELGYQVVGLIEDDPSDGPGVLGSIADLPLLARQHFIDEVFVALPWNSAQLRDTAAYARSLGLSVRIMPDAADGLSWGAPLSWIGPVPVVDVHRTKEPAVALWIKRAIDMVTAAVALVLLSPVLAVVAAAIKLDSPGSVFYVAPRVGRRGEVFPCLKFRSMIFNADALKAELRKHNERRGPFFKIADDPRLTRVGRFIRKYSLDELPQLWNVLCGDMSLVGPRPHPLDDYHLYSPDHLRRLDASPGITGLWQVTARRDPSWERGMALDLEYIENWSLWMDFRILLKTVPAVFEGDGQ